MSSLAIPRFLLSALLVGATAAPALAHRSDTAAWKVVATGLNNPRGLDFAPNGALYVAESGIGGDGPTIEGPEGPVHFGLSGSITRVFRGTQKRVVTGLPSLAADGGFGASGPSSIVFDRHGHALVTIGLAMDPAIRDTVLGPQAAALGTLQWMNHHGRLKFLADIAGFEAANDPDGAGPDSNPNGVLHAWNGGAYVADAGANALLRVDRKGGISVVAVFPDRIVPTPPSLPQPPFPPELPMQAVPTNVVRGRDGALYVSQLTGFPFPVGGAKIFRVVPGSAPTVYAEGFTNIIDLEFDARGNLYVLEIDQNGLLAPEPTGRLARVKRHGGVETVASEGLVMPGGLAIGPDGAIYLSNYSTAPGAGEVVRIRP